MTLGYPIFECFFQNMVCEWCPVHNILYNEIGIYHIWKKYKLVCVNGTLFTVHFSSNTVHRTLYTLYLFLFTETFHPWQYRLKIIQNWDVVPIYEYFFKWIYVDCVWVLFTMLCSIQNVHYALLNATCTCTLFSLKLTSTFILPSPFLCLSPTCTLPHPPPLHPIPFTLHKKVWYIIIWHNIDNIRPSRITQTLPL